MQTTQPLQTRNQRSPRVPSAQNSPTQYGIATDGISWLFIRKPEDQRKNVEVLEYHSFRGAVFEALISIDAVQPQLETERVLWNSSVGKAANAPYQQYGKLHREPINESIQIFKTNSHPVTSLHTQTPKHMTNQSINTFNANPSSTHSDSTLDEFK